MSVRVQVVMDDVERESFRQAADREGLSLSDWMRRAARERMRAARTEPLRTAAELREFFARCEARETGVEPDWDDHRAVIETSTASGRSTT